ncbi:MAG: acyl-CoA dehydrogenase family protein [Dehalococcoidia bacterium]
MNFRETAAQQSFRRQISDFIGAHLPPDWLRVDGPEREAVRNGFLTALGERGWVAPAWPREYGGAGMSYYEQFVFNEEMAKARAPAAPGVGVATVGPTLIMHGSEEQRRTYLQRILDLSMIWCQGFSEPSAGSDLASLTTRAVRQGDTFVVNGQKIWTSLAHRADRMLLLARTDPDAPKHRGITAFLLDMKTPGITVAPIVNMLGHHGFNQDYFDDVVVPAEDLLGELHGGWSCARTTLNTERSQIRSVSALAQTVDDFIVRIQERREQVNAIQRLQVVDRSVEVAVGRMMAFRVVTMQEAGIPPVHESSCQKLYLSELAQRVAQTGMSLVGLFGQGSSPQDRRSFGWRAQQMYLSTVTSTIAGGTSEVQRNIIATRGLGLPR